MISPARALSSDNARQLALFESRLTPAQQKFVNDVVAFRNINGVTSHPKMHSLSLRAEAALVFGKQSATARPLHVCSNLGEVARFVSDASEFPKTVQDHLKGALFEQLRSVTTRESDNLAHAVAAARVSDTNTTESCVEVGNEHALPTESHRALKMVAAYGRAGKRAHNGENCRTVAGEHGIDTPEARLALEMFAVKGLAGKRARNGEPPYKIAREHGMQTWGDAWKKLQQIASQAAPS
ncbi:MAG: hypothetical protein LBV73_17735 [Paraburkholderia sp.]|nr:hypothetical protein [Paraburkholderia sp.]